MAHFIKVTLWGREGIFINMDKVVTFRRSPYRKASSFYDEAPERTSIEIEGKEEWLWVSETPETILARIYGTQR